MSQTYLTTEELSGRIKYDAKTIRRKLKDSVLIAYFGDCDHLFRFIPIT